jgi:hypothetical protein
LFFFVVVVVVAAVVAVLGIELRKHCTTELHPKPSSIAQSKLTLK